MMSDRVYRAHLLAGKTYGRDAACGTKVDYKTEESAVRAATLMSIRHRRDLEPYPCYWCEGWHIGRTMDPEELGTFLALLV